MNKKQSNKPKYKELYRQASAELNKTPIIYIQGAAQYIYDNSKAKWITKIQYNVFNKQSECCYDGKLPLGSHLVIPDTDSRETLYSVDIELIVDNLGNKVESSYNAASGLFKTNYTAY